MKRKSPVVSDDLRAEYNFDYSKGVRGKYYKRITNVVILDPDVAAVFGSSKAVNAFLHSVITTLPFRVHKRAKAG